MNEPMPNLGDQWKLKGTIAADDIRLRTGAQLRDVDVTDLSPLPSGG